MRIHCQLRVYPAEDFARLLRCGVVFDDSLAVMLRHLRRAFQERLRRDDFVDEQVSALRELHEIVAWARVAGQHDNPILVLYAIAKRGRDRSVVNVKDDHTHIALLVLEAFSNILRNDVNAGLREQFVEVAPDVYVRLIRLFQIRHHVHRAVRSPDLEGGSTSHNPSRQPQVRYAHDMVGVQVCQEQPVHARVFGAELEEPLERAAPAVEQQPLVARLH